MRWIQHPPRILLYSMEAGPIIDSLPIPIPKSQSEVKLQILDDWFLYIKKLPVNRTINCYGRNSLNCKHKKDKLMPQRETALSLGLWKIRWLHQLDACEFPSSCHTESILGAGVCSPTYARVWAIPQVSFILTFGNIHQGCEYSQLVEDRFCWQDIIYGRKWDILLGCLV